MLREFFTQGLLKKVVRGIMGREKRGGYIIEWWMGDHSPKHVHIYKNGKQVAKVVIPSKLLLFGRMTAKLDKIIDELIKEKRI